MKNGRSCPQWWKSGGDGTPLPGCHAVIMRHLDAAVCVRKCS
jgi:hypothetical protein